MTTRACGARTAFSAWKDPSTTEWFAIVVTNPVIRVASNFIMRDSTTARLRRKLFSTEEAAVRWLDERAREDAAK